ncbi:MAG: TIGR02996 domain-containing protein, partial [Gemmatimonadales bacterium]
MTRKRTARSHEELGLLKAIQEDPTNDAVRLVYADWLEEHGGLPRAEFVRGQVALAGMAEDSPRRRELAFRCRRLLDKHEGRWAGSLSGDCPERHWSRGFMEVVGFDPQTLERNREVAFRLTPTRRLILTGLDNKADALALIPPDHRLDALELIDCQLDLRGLKALCAESARFGKLAELSLMFNRLQDSSVEFLRQHAFFQDLSLLRLACNPFTSG